MLKFTALQKTFLKKSPQDSSNLPPSMYKLIERGKTYTGEKIAEQNQHLLIELSYGQGQWWLFIPHWEIDGNKEYFPSGLPIPKVIANPKTTNVIEAIVKYCVAVGVTDLKHIAYVLATAEGEANFKPIKEIRGRYLTRDQQRYWHTGFYGRGLVQLTWKGNYQRMGDKLGIDLLNNPDLMLTHSVAIAALVIGMRDGMFTGRKLNSYVAGDYWNQRNIVNPGEIKFSRYHAKANRFVLYARKWERYLTNFADYFNNIYA